MCFHRFNTSWLLKGLLVGAFVLGWRMEISAQSNLEPEHSFSYSPNAGWLNWRPDAQVGAVVGEFFCSGYIYSANAGWIHLGDGHPANGISYSNESADDFGVNHDRRGNLRGYAYGANIGWIQFGDTGAPRINLKTGQLDGAVYGANVGWIELSTIHSMLRVEDLALGPDTDEDGIPDAWEWLHVEAGLDELGNGDSDADGDGATDFDEYGADTDPFDATDLLKLTEVSYEGSGLVHLGWEARETRVYQVEMSFAVGEGEIWIPLGQPVRVAEPAFLERSHDVGLSLPHGIFRLRADRHFSK